MHIDKYKKNNGYHDENGCFYERAEDFLQIKILGFCGCDDPNKNLKYIHDGLEHINATYTNELGWYEKWITKGHKIFGNEQSMYFFFHWCDKEGLIEHSSPIPGWLSEKGKELLEDLTELLSN